MISKSHHWKNNPCDHTRLRLIDGCKHHIIREVDGKFLKVWRDEFIGYYECEDCHTRGEIDSWDMKYNWEDRLSELLND